MGSHIRWRFCTLYTSFFFNFCEMAWWWLLWPKIVAINMTYILLCQTEYVHNFIVSLNPYICLCPHTENRLMYWKSKIKFNTRIIKQFSSNTSCFIVCEATYFGPYMTINRPSYESSEEMFTVHIWIVNIVGIPTYSQHLLTWFANRPDDCHVRTETCSITHNKTWCVWRKLFYYSSIEL